MLYRSVLVALLAMALAATGCTPEADDGSDSDREPRSAMLASAESSFTAMQSRLESAAAFALESSPTTDTLEELPRDLRDLGVNGRADVVLVDGRRFVLLTGEYRTFRKWDGYLYSESGSPPPILLGAGTNLRDAIQVHPNWWWIRVARIAVVRLYQYAPSDK